jgi:hypothetical protein
MKYTRARVVLWGWAAVMTMSTKNFCRSNFIILSFGNETPFATSSDGLLVDILSVIRVKPVYCYSLLMAGGAGGPDVPD